ncbi:MAG TPA: CocE/NonD family hydrolase [Solirubrobacteraceae bacterium]|nr:CocE/NonD family hydrolase [Solirubrobacteraceae bacterium]
MAETNTGTARDVTVEFDVPAQMRDGVMLRANVYRPAGDGPWPTLLARTPYDKNATEWLDPVQTAAQGFIVVIQDSRGRFASDGEWMPLRAERKDGYDAVEWAAKLPGSNGRVGMFGVSYVGHTQWLAAIEQPPSLAAIAPAMTHSEPSETAFVRGGALEIGIAHQWTLQMAIGDLVRQRISDRERSERLTALLDDLDQLSSAGYWALPAEMPLLLRSSDTSEALLMFDDPEVLAWGRVAGEYERVTVPSFNISGWYDSLAQGVLDNYMGMAALGSPARLVMGPWSHGAFADPIGELCFGMRSSYAGAPAHAHGDTIEEQLAWFRRYLLPGAVDEADDSQPPVRIFVMGRNEWRDEQEWPLARARTERWFLGADGALRPDGPEAGDEPTEFLYDPADPVPAHGGSTILTPSFPAGPMDQARVEARPDVCVFTSEVLQKDLDVTGRVRVVLHAESSAPSTDWVARLCDVHPHGRSFNICDGIVRVKKGADRLQEIAIDLWSTSNVFLAGHRLRVHVTSSSFPRWDRNLNTGNQRESRMQAARQRIHHDTDRPSFIELPVVDTEGR